MVLKRIYLQHFDIYGNLIDVITCRNCGHQTRKDDIHSFSWYDATVGCCEAPFYLNGIFVPDDSDEGAKE